MLFQEVCLGLYSSDISSTSSWASACGEMQGIGGEGGEDGPGGGGLRRQEGEITAFTACRLEGIVAPP